MSFSSKILNDGLPLLVNPMVDIEHSSNRLDLSILITVPELATDEVLCSVEYLTPVKYNTSGICYTGPILIDDLALITSCSNTKTIVKADSLAKCFQQDNSLLCPQHNPRPVHDLEWLGLPWNAKSHMTFPRHHQPAMDCSHLIPLLHLGGRSCLSTTTGRLQLNVGSIELAPLMIYHFPCNVTFWGVQTGLSHCPQRIKISVPILQPDEIKYVSWNAAAHHDTLQLQYRQMQIPPPLQMNKTTFQHLDQTYRLLDGQLTNQINLVRKNIKKIHDAKVTTTAEVCAYLGLTIATLFSIVFLILFCRCRHRFRYHFIPVPEPREPTQAPMELIVVNGNPDNCIACDKTIEQTQE
ncbi:MAG: hypothetical protein DSY43_05495 [Gammaproteobacteria bacterium]|nr:MAG: hypothetical protein DSY43_05495 [Gammaproteobacteria bacterium]